MKLFLPQRPESTRGHISLHSGRIRATKDTSEIDSHTRLGSDMGATRDATHSFLIGQSVEGSLDDSNDGKHQEEEVIDTLNTLASNRDARADGWWDFVVRVRYFESISAERSCLHILRRLGESTGFSRQKESKQ